MVTCLFARKGRRLLARLDAVALAGEPAVPVDGAAHVPPGLEAALDGHGDGLVVAEARLWQTPSLRLICATLSSGPGATGTALNPPAPPGAQGTGEGGVASLRSSRLT